MQLAVPQSPVDLTVDPFHEVGAKAPRFLVRTNGNAFVVDEATRAVIAALACGPDWTNVERHLREHGSDATRERFVADASAVLARIVPGTTPARRKTPFLVHFVVVKAAWARKITDALAHAYRPPVVVAAIVAFCALGLVTFPRIVFFAGFTLSASELWALLGAIVVSSLIHELGHAAAARRFAVTHGEIGFGLYLIYPMFYIDVDDLWRAKPAHRVIVNLGGMYFQMIVLVPVLAALAVVKGVPDFAWTFVWITMLTMVQNLNPTFKMDGYWVLTDAAGLTNLHRRAFAALRAPRAFVDPAIPLPQRVALGAYFALVAGYLGFVVFTIVRAVALVGPTAVPYVRDALDQINVGYALHDAAIAQSGVWAILLGITALLLAVLPLVVLARRLGSRRLR